MYELQLALNIVFEWALLHWIWTLVYLLVLLDAIALGLWRGLRWPYWRALLPLAAGLFGLALLSVPALTGASLGDLDYWVDWVNLAAIASGFAAAITVPVWLMQGWWRSA